MGETNQKRDGSPPKSPPKILGGDLYVSGSFIRCMQ